MKCVLLMSAFKPCNLLISSCPQGLYKSDVRYGPGFETYSDGCQDVGIWKGQQLFRLCTVVPGSISTLSYPQFSQPQKTNKRCVSEDHDSVTEKGKTEDPFLFRYKFLLLEDRFTLPEKIYSYSSDTDHLPITPTEHLEFNQHFYRDKDRQEVCSHVTFDNVQPNSGMRKIYLHVNEHRLVENAVYIGKKDGEDYFAHVSDHSQIKLS